MSMGRFISIIHRKRQHYIKKELKKLGVGISEYPILLIVNTGKVLGVTEIADNYSLAKSQVSQSVRKLEVMEYLTQERDPNYRNKVKIQITEKGKGVANKVKKILIGWEEAGTADFTKEEKETLTNLLMRITDNISEGRIESLVEGKKEKK